MGGLFRYIYVKMIRHRNWKGEIDMRKKIIIFALIVVLLAGSLISLWPTLENMAFEAKLKAISNAWLEEGHSVSLIWYHIHGCGSYYLGSENGYDIFYVNSGYEPGSAYTSLGMGLLPTEKEINAMPTTEIAGTIFYPASAGELLVYCKNDPVVYRNGPEEATTHFQTLSSLYEAGKISKSAVDEAAKWFHEYLDIWETDAEELWYAKFKYDWYTLLQEDDRFKIERLRKGFIRFRDRLEQEGLRIPDWVDDEEELPH